MRKIGRYRRKKQKKILIIGSLSLLLFLCVGYAAFSTNLSITAKGNVKEKTRVIQSWEENSQTDFHSDFYKENIVSATFLDNNNVPSNATESWNVSEDKVNGGVMAWVIPNNADNTKYDLYIGAQSGVIANEDSGYLFYNLQNIESINFNNNFDTSNVNDMSRMFQNCKSLKSLNLNNFDTSNVITMANMFDNCSNLQTLDISNFKTNQVTNMAWMFAHIKVDTLDLSSFDTSSVTTMIGMFSDCSNLQSLNLSNFDTSKVTDMSYMFSMGNNISAETSTGKLTTLDLSSFNTSKVTTMAHMFEYNKNMVEIKGLENFDTSNVTDMFSMFSRLQSITTLNLCSFNTSKVTDMSYMFDWTFKLENIYVGTNWNTSKANTQYMFSSSSVSSVTTGQC